MRIQLMAFGSLTKLPNMEESTKTCTICESNRIRKIINWDSYSIHKCRDCKLIFATPLPDDSILKDFYQGFLFNKPDKSEVTKQIEKRKKELVKLFTLKSNLQNKNFLDYGGGTGSAFKAACELNLRVYYHDLDEKAEAFVKEEYGLTDEFIIDNVEDTNVRFDYIFSDNVIEHVKDPVKYLKDLKNILKENGQIVLKTPHGGNTESIFYPMISIRDYLFRALKYNSPLDTIKSYFIRFWHCAPPRHLFSFSKQSLKLIGLKAGFDENDIEILYYKLPLFKYSITKLVLNFRRYNSMKRLLLRLFLLIFIPFEIVSKISQMALLTLGVLSPGGIILGIKKLQSENRQVKGSNSINC